VFAVALLGAAWACSPKNSSDDDDSGGKGGTTATTGGTGGSDPTGSGGVAPSGGTAGNAAETGGSSNAGNANGGTAGHGDTAGDAGDGSGDSGGQGGAAEHGCTSDSECVSNPRGHYCDIAHGTCVPCKTDDNCTAGKVCTSKGCVKGCKADSECGSGETCCDSACVNTQTDADHCGGCDTACKTEDNTKASCDGGVCKQKCSGSFADCDGDAANGCEWDTEWGGPCLCTPGKTEDCYSGPPGTKGVAACKGGTHTCADNGVGFGPCEGEVAPKQEICGNGIDEDCNGVTDDNADADGDGWSVCDGDCCDTAGACSSSPALVNPGAYDVPADGVDNDCNGTVDDVPPTDCSTADKLTGVTATDVAHAMDICQTTTQNPALKDKKWGLISATQLHADSSAFATATDATDKQTAVKKTFGSVITPKKNATLAVISSGMARAEDDTGWTSPSTSIGSYVTFPGAPPLSTFLGQHSGGLPPGHCGATTCTTGTGANDSIDIHLVLRVPTNAKSFSYDFRFFSMEYQSYQCTSYNDYYLALLQSGASAIPADHNISFDSLLNPVSVNNGFFQDCGGNGKNCGDCPFGVASLAGTGFDTVSGGATEWLTTDAPVIPGETVTLDLMIFDVGDTALDSLVLLDNFRWHVDAVEVGTHQ
jgi:hypothetical protein